MKRFDFLRNEAGDGGEGGGGAAVAEPAPASTPTPASGGGAAPAGNLVPAAVAGGSQPSAQPGGEGGQTPAAPSGHVPATGEFTFGSFLGEDGTFKPGFTEALTKAHPDLADGASILSRYKDPVSMAKALVHANQLASRKLQGIDDILNVDPSDERGMALKREKLGIPTNAEGYNLKFPEKLADGTPVRKELVGSDENLKEFAEWAHANDVPKALADKLVEFDAERATKAMAAAEAQAKAQADQQLAQDAATLKSELGSKYDRSMDLLVRLLERGGMTREQIATTQALRDLDVTKALIKLASESGDDTLPASSAQSSGLDSGSAARDIINNPANPLHKAYWSGDETANAKVSSLLKQEAAAKRALTGG